METILILVFIRQKPGGLTGALVQVHVQIYSVTSQTGVIMGLLVKINKQTAMEMSMVHLPYPLIGRVDSGASTLCCPEILA